MPVDSKGVEKGGNCSEVFFKRHFQISFISKRFSSEGVVNFTFLK